MPTEKGWAIVGEHGLYTGWSQHRTEAISEHVHAFDTSLPQLSFRLNYAQREAWKRRKRAGDKAVRVTITY